MNIFETIIGLLVSAAILSSFAKRFMVPYPAILAIGGVGIALLPIQNITQLNLSPELVLALFVAPALLSAAHDISLRDLRKNWRPISSLVIVAVGITTLAVAYVAHYLLPEMPWAVAIALGALLAPPDAVAAMAVLSQVNPPHKIRTVLEGESLFNDATSLLIYKLAVGVVLVGSFHPTDVFPPFFLVMFGSVAAGWAFAHLAKYQFNFAMDTPIAVILQFALTFGVWILAERLGLSGVITIVVFGLVLSRYSTLSMPVRLRVSSFAIWESAIFILNALAFTLIGLQVRPILAKLESGEAAHLVMIALIILGVVIVVRLLWVMAYILFSRSSAIFGKQDKPLSASIKSGLVISWSGMRGIVTLSAAMALPEMFPYRDFIQLTAFVVVLGTLLIQGISLGPLLKRLRFPEDSTIHHEVNLTRTNALHAAIKTLQGNQSVAAQRLMSEYVTALNLTSDAQDPHDTEDNLLRVQAVSAARQTIFDLLINNDISDEAYRLVEEELDWLELSASAKH